MLRVITVYSAAALLCLWALCGLSSGASTFQARLPPAVDPKTGGKLWVVLAAGSDGYYNYRHQADICHAYQIVKKHGVPDENIIVFMRDDIAYNKANPNKGVIINRPNGPNVYKGVPKDYVGDNLKPELFLDVLAGKEISVGSKKTLRTGKEDSVFVNFADHGAPGIVEFGDDNLKATDLNRVLKKMHRDHKFKQLTFYIEACESGSMFEKLLPKNIGVFATTASNSTESSYACYQDEKLDTYIGDCYSVNWMEDTDKADVNKETLQQQFMRVRKETNTSHVTEFGNLSLSSLTLGNFLGSKDDSERGSLRDNPDHSKQRHAVPQYEVTKKILELKMAKTNNELEYQNLREELDSVMRTRANVESTLKSIVSAIPGFDPSNVKPLLGEGQSLMLTEGQLDGCYYHLVGKFLSACFPRSTPGFDFVFHSLRVFASICLHPNTELEQVLASMDTYC